MTLSFLKIFPQNIDIKGFSTNQQYWHQICLTQTGGLKTDVN
jgi:hypothetical protein